MRIQRSSFVGILTFLALVLVLPPATAADRLRVLATTTIVADLVRQVAGERAEIEALMGPGVDPHLYKASARDVTRLGRADVVFYSGLFLEGRMEEVFEKVKKRGRRVYAVTDSIPADRLLRPAQFEGHPDPHAWGDPILWSHCVSGVAKTLAELDPAGAEFYRSRAAAYVTALKTLHEWAKARIQEIPREQRVLITSHDAFNYLGRAFDIEVIGIQGISTATDASLSNITRLVDIVRSRKVKAVFVESSVPPATIQRVSSDAGARIGGELFSDALGTPGEFHQGGGERYDVGTYIGMIKHNINIIVDALK